MRSSVATWSSTSTSRPSGRCSSGWRGCSHRARSSFSVTRRACIASAKSTSWSAARFIDAGWTSVNKKIRVLIVDDSSLVRQMLTDILNEAPDIEVVGVASDPLFARERIKALNPDVLTLDVEMPRMDGLTFLSNLMRLRPMPVLMVSSLTERGAQTTLRALELGAVDFVSKPKTDLTGTLRDFSEEICTKVRAAAGARVRARADEG